MLSCLSWDVHLPLPSDFDAPGSPAFGLRLGLTPLAPLVLRPSDLHRNDTTGFHYTAMKYYSALKNKEILPFVTTWMDLEGIILSEISQID